MKAYVLTLLAALLCVTSSRAQCHDTCFLCLSEAEARAAAHKAVDGEYATVRLRTCTQVVLGLRGEVVALRQAADSATVALDRMDSAYAKQQEATVIATKALKMQRRSATWHTLLYSAACVAFGVLISR